MATVSALPKCQIPMKLAGQARMKQALKLRDYRGPFQKIQKDTHLRESTRTDLQTSRSGQGQTPTFHQQTETRHLRYKQQARTQRRISCYAARQSYINRLGLYMKLFQNIASKEIRLL